MTEDLTPVAFERIVEVLNRHRVKYLVIGGLAALLQGAALPRTADMDVTPAPDGANKKRLAGALRELQARLRVPGAYAPVEVPLDERSFSGMVTMTFVTRFGPLDICFVPDETTGFDDLRQDARTVERLGVKIPLASLADIVRSKRAAGREKDAAHLRILTDRISGDPGRS